MKKLLWVMLLVLPLASNAPAQDKPADATNMQILREKVRADKKFIVAANMQLTEEQAKVFWPIYEAYQKDLEQIDERLAKAIVGYADAYNARAFTDPLAKKLLDETLAIEDAETGLRKTYAARLTKVVPATIAARYLQIEGKMHAAIRYEMAGAIPLIEPSSRVPTKYPD